ncbi:complex I NDUFA9 subunit family protein [Ktedonobacter racemifer]|uniref:3-beta hydroxysteroid dehydrogenase/isomerase n=1 Tax=Ktedonobacter racemifer DSM 44963 TaxID=485913 RepID=D6TNV1_KTERA|nr:complex I NDUFA9 subunit family protein [Ktedonobacter racemifer]EFH85487.1 3-beta hydroxysteroid dehydrogenase/isomerase [Ktedonobacter racemifer DSM 44963]
MILVTGATGFIGSHLVTDLAGQGEQVRCLVRDRKKAEKSLPGTNVELVEGSTIHPETLKEALQGIDTVVHAAFMTADRKESAENHYNETNVTGTRNLVKAAQEAGVKRIIEIGGLGTKPGKPGSYMQGRYLAEQAVKESKLDWTIIQPSVLFGKGAPFIKGLSDLIASAPVVPLIGGGKTMFQPILVDDVVRVIEYVLKEPEQTKGKTYTIGGPEYYSFSEVFDLLLKTMGKSRPKVYAPMPLVGIGAAVMEAVLPKPPLTRAAMTLFSFDNTTAINSVERDFGFTPVSFRTHLEAHGI